MQRLYSPASCSGLAMVITLMIPSGVFMRYVMNNPLQWPEPASVIMMVFFCSAAPRSTAPTSRSRSRR